ncbi:RMD1 family protein [Marinoscillum furvescens]|uniref:Putative Rmd1/YagE family protein n=1 Tax=Marinoscillum furvescens DSM 4134 TaxID=1122208 RepID=A0A3D9L2I3_MARFU|nr:RMD1 family protein [Marinoscillum furvescens]RED97907.1 putative Rmd1/YagE family protein [Marinoscillum furvescens DSM 4134]
MEALHLAFKAHHIADKLDVAKYKQTYPDCLIATGTRELYYQFEMNRYAYIVSYGAVVLAGFDDEEEFLKKLKPFATELHQHPSKDDLEVIYASEDQSLSLSFDTLSLGRLDVPTNKLVMMHLAQTVALAHYNTQSQALLSELKTYTLYMQKYGKVKLGHKKALQFIGKSLTAKNNIAENLYILDSPKVAWEDEYLDKLHATLAHHFELVPRYREIDNTLKIIEDNLAIYISYNHHRESSRLEWIIIILIVIEVIDTFWSKL